MGKKILLAWSFLLIAMMTVGYLFFYQEKYRLALDEIVRVQETLSLIYDAQSNLSDAEAIVRGYVLDGDEGQLQIFGKALKDLDHALDRLNRVTANEPEPQRLLGELTLLIGRRQALLQVSIDLRRLKGSEVPEHVVVTREGTKVQNQIRQLFDQMEDYANKMLEPDWPKEKDRIQTRVLALYLVTFGSLSLLLLPLYFLNREINQRKQAEEKVVAYQEDLRSYASQLSLAEERERHRIGAHLHDHIGQALALANIKLGELLDPPIPATGSKPDRLIEIRRLLEQAIHETQSLTFTISSPILHEIGLEAALAWLTENSPGESGLAAFFESDDQPKPVAEEVGLLLYQIVAELLANVVKHAQAQHVKVSLWRESDRLQVAVEDDGVGFEVGDIGSRWQEAKSYGLFSIRERLAPFGGSMTVDSKPGEGTQVTVSVPLET
ncbi:MAG: CHASE3 domain-containing protein [Proteobacteria bacterium]|nr:CHASE3 domain-containing protein [Pseudomonadota bacterium]MBU4354303.1 CHASE3 domain-containing protein [Pseudomonadota bacterium]MBU4447924.1 CHASE3 domain-containing protein [Pseudomonadota bacterium]MCG2770910.1 CHASE3 domain-containing protein [Desulfobacterales bacterium]